MAEINTLKIGITGRCKLDVEAILKEMPSIIFAESIYTDKESHKKIWSDHYHCVYSALPSKKDKAVYTDAYERTFKDRSWPLSLNTHGKEAVISQIEEEFTSEFMEEVNAMNELHLSFKCYLKTDGICIVSLAGRTFWMFPDRFVKIEEYTDYTALSGSERISVLSGKTADKDTDIISAENISYRDAIARKNDAIDVLSSLNAKMNDVKNANTEELSRLQEEINKLTAQMEEKKRNLLEDLEAKKREMSQKLEELENTVFKLDSEIYSIRCYTGEVVETNQIRSGKPAEEDTPIIFYQKMRYLDEELGKIASLYDVDFGDAKYFESIIANRNDVFDAFLPAKRSIALVRVSRTGTGFSKTDYPGLLEKFKKYHGEKVAILIRDGENLYISWTDDDRIDFKEDAFLKPGTRVLEDEEANELSQRKYETDKEYEDRIKEYQKATIKESLGRYFVFSLLQGMLDRGLIKLPENVKITDSKYIIFSMADGWLNDNKYGTFGEMIDRCNASVKIRDSILMTSSLYARSDECKNDRGRGYADRTHDVYARDKEIYPINLIEHIALYEYADEYVTVLNAATFEEEQRKRRVELTDEEYRYRCEKYEEKLNAVEGTDKYKYYVSLRKQYSWSGEARANFQVYKEEFINMTFMNSVWLEYVLTNNKTGNVRIGGQSVDFAHTIPYIKTALSFCKEREKKVAKWIWDNMAADILEDKEWPVKLSEWMLEKDIHNFSEYRTKQFIKDYRK